MYECYPLAFVIEQAGGKACDGQANILDIEPKQIHQRSITYLGSDELIEDLDGRIKDYNKLIMKQLELV